MRPLKINISELNIVSLFCLVADQLNAENEKTFPYQYSYTLFHHFFAKLSSNALTLPQL